MVIENIEVKVYAFEEATGSLIVAFKDAADTSSIDDKQRVAYQPHMFEATDPAEVIKHIAKLGMYVAQEEKKKETLLATQNTVAAFKAMAGQTQQYSLADLGLAADPAEVVV